MTLTEFLLARIAEDETVARELMEIWERIGHEFGPGIDTTAWGEPMEPDPWLEASEEYPVVNVNPLRVLAECDAKRRILALHPISDAITEWYGDDEEGPDGLACALCGWPTEFAVRWPCATLRSLALPYATHPDYQQEWKP